MKKTPLKKRPSRSLYYAALSKIAAFTALGIVGLTILGTVYNLFAYHYVEGGFRMLFSTVMFILANLILIVGGFGIGYAFLKNLAKSKRERMVLAAAFGLLSYYFYNLVFDGIIWALLRYTTHTYLPHTEYGPLVVLLLSGLVAFLWRKNVRMGRKNLMLGLVLFFWAEQLWQAVETLIIITGNMPDATMGSVAWWVFIPGLLTSPLIAGLVYFGLIRRQIGRLARVFYATFFAAAVNIGSILVWSFDTSHQLQTANIIQLIWGVVSILLFAGFGIGLYLIRRIA